MVDPIETHDLDDILAEFDRTHEHRPVTEADAAQDRMDRWLASFDELRERVVRPELEDVAWRVEQKGHHAWVDGILAPDDTTDVEGIELKVLPASDKRSARMAPGLWLRPDARSERVLVDVHSLTPDDQEPHSIARLQISQLKPETVRDLATRLVDAVFLHHDRVLEHPLVDSGSDGPRDDLHDWSPEVGGIEPRQGRSTDWV